LRRKAAWLTAIRRSASPPGRCSSFDCLLFCLPLHFLIIQHKLTTRTPKPARERKEQVSYMLRNICLLVNKKRIFWFINFEAKYHFKIVLLKSNKYQILVKAKNKIKILQLDCWSTPPLLILTPERTNLLIRFALCSWLAL
jgi:hypothetical protein